MCTRHRSQVNHSDTYASSICTSIWQHEFNYCSIHTNRSSPTKRRSCYVRSPTRCMKKYVHSQCDVVSSLHVCTHQKECTWYPFRMLLLLITHYSSSIDTPKAAKTREARRTNALTGNCTQMVSMEAPCCAASVSTESKSTCHPQPAVTPNAKDEAQTGKSRLIRRRGGTSEDKGRPASLMEGNLTKNQNVILLL